MENKINWDEVPEDRLEEARDFDERLRIYETGFIIITETRLQVLL